MLIVDQLTKQWALSALADEPVELLGPMRLVLVFNRDAAFGLGGGLAPVLAAAALVVVLVIVGRGDLLRHGPAAVAVGLVVGGAVGNLVDRALRDGGDGLLGGAVVDFVDVGPWPVFNVADSAIVVGAALLVLAARRAG